MCRGSTARGRALRNHRRNWRRASCGGTRRARRRPLRRLRKRSSKPTRAHRCECANPHWRQDSRVSGTSPRLQPRARPVRPCSHHRHLQAATRLPAVQTRAHTHAQAAKRHTGLRCTLAERGRRSAPCLPAEPYQYGKSWSKINARCRSCACSRVLWRGNSPVGWLCASRLRRKTPGTRTSSGPAAAAISRIHSLHQPRS
mmetsp:Transcript_24881/g.62581  ORF Transcript_24881/g.62581 Transcript_24881/m.62581 type:complete len:200 (+) Transcript_24881:4244-4843(+)